MAAADSANFKGYLKVDSFHTFSGQFFIIFFGEMLVPWTVISPALAPAPYICSSYVSSCRSGCGKGPAAPVPNIALLLHSCRWFCSILSIALLKDIASGQRTRHRSWWEEESEDNHQLCVRRRCPRGEGSGTENHWLQQIVDGVLLLE